MAKINTVVSIVSAEKRERSNADAAWTAGAGTL
jgi:hypothetical protein